MHREFIVTAVNYTSLSCLELPGRDKVVLRPVGGVRREVEGEALTVQMAKEWTFARNRYVSGKVVGSRIDGAVLSPIPLRLYERFEWDPMDDFLPHWIEDIDCDPDTLGGFDEEQDKEDEEGEEPIDWAHLETVLPDWVVEIGRSGKRMAYEMEQILPYHVLPGGSADDPDCDPIVYAVECKEYGDYGQAFDILQKCLKEDLRCIDAYVHLGNFRVGDLKYEYPVREGIKSYQAAVAVGEQALPPGFDGVLEWSMIDNRPFLRALHGLGLCLWRLSDISSARQVIRRLLRLNPHDNQGARFTMAGLDAGLDYQSWRDAYE